MRSNYAEKQKLYRQPIKETIYVCLRYSFDVCVYTNLRAF